jgi:uncharacterized phage protein (TIGR01671 family)
MNNRPIKFRVWDKVSQKYYGDMATRIIFASTASQCDKFSPEFNIMEYPGLGAAMQSTKKSVHDLIFQQFTGLTDKNGVEIYEGDILYKKYKDIEYFFEVLFGQYDGLDCDTNLGWYLKILDGEKWTTSLPDEKDIAVIGNIFQNPELIK